MLRVTAMATDKWPHPSKMLECPPGYPFVPLVIPAVGTNKISIHVLHCAIRPFWTVFTKKACQPMLPCTILTYVPYTTFVPLKRLPHIHLPHRCYAALAPHHCCCHKQIHPCLHLYAKPSRIRVSPRTSQCVSLLVGTGKACYIPITVFHDRVPGQQIVTKVTLRRAITVIALVPHCAILVLQLRPGVNLLNSHFFTATRHYATGAHRTPLPGLLSRFW